MGKKKESCAYQTMETIDLFAEQPHLTMYKKRVLRTTLGGILTIALIIFIVYQASVQLDGMFHHEDPLLYEIDDLEEDPTKVTLSPDNNFFLAVTVFANGANTNFSQAAPFNFRTTFSRHTITNGVKTKKTYPVLWAPCVDTDFPSTIFGKSYSALNFKYAYCTVGINFTSSTDGSCPDDIAEKYPSCISPKVFDLEGAYGDPEFDFLQSTLMVCDPADTTKPATMVCATGDIMSTFSTVSYEFDIYIANTVINRLNYNLPNKTFIDNTYWVVNPLIYKVSNILVDKVTLQDFDSYFSSTEDSNHTFYAAKMTNIREINTWRTTPNPVLLQWNLKRSNTNQVVVRTYSKVQEFLTDLGGFSKALMFMAAFIAIGYLRYRYQMTLANELYDFELPDEPSKSLPEKLRINTPNESPISFEFSQSNAEFGALMSPKGNITQKSFMFSPKSLIAGPKSIDGVNDKAVTDFFASLRKRKKLDVGEWKYVKANLYYIFCCKRNIHEGYATKGRSFAMKDIDIFSIMRKLNEIEKLKTVLFNDLQKKGLDLIGNPFIALEEKKLIHRDSILAWKLSQPTLATKQFDERSETVVPDARVSVRYTPDVFSTLPKYGKLYVAYKALKDDKDSDRITQVYNRKLIEMLNPNLVKVFKRAEQILGEDFDPHHFEEVIKQILDG